MKSWAFVSTAGTPGWKIVGANDFDHDGTPDLVFQNDRTMEADVYDHERRARRDSTRFRGNLSGISWLARDRKVKSSRRRGSFMAAPSTLK